MEDVIYKINRNAQYTNSQQGTITVNESVIRLSVRSEIEPEDYIMGEGVYTAGMLLPGIPISIQKSKT